MRFESWTVSRDMLRLSVLARCCSSRLLEHCPQNFQERQLFLRQQIKDIEIDKRKPGTKRAKESAFAAVDAEMRQECEVFTLSAPISYRYDANE
jgi:hypothetical protein